MKAPFPWFGGKSRAAHLVWGAFGDLPNYVEPFAGSLAVLLKRPHEPRVETVNDLDCFLANFWRAVQLAPDDVARWADWPVNEADLHARHRFLVGQAAFRERMKHEPDFFDAKIAGWWVWGLCQWIGSGWCTNPEWTGRSNAGRSNAGRRARGVNTSEQAVRPGLASDNGIRRLRDTSSAAEWGKRPILGKGGIGVHAKRPRLASGGRGVGRETHEKLPKMDRATASRLQPSQQIPQLGGDSGAAGRGVHASAIPAGAIYEYMQDLAARLRRVRVCCGDWKRVLGRSATECIGTTGIFLDPPYGAGAGRDPSLYAEESATVATDVRKWALEHGDNPKLLIALCGYEGEHDMPKGWQVVEWKAAGGYASAAGNTENAARERIWFSPHCARAADQAQLFGGGAW